MRQQRRRAPFCSERAETPLPKHIFESTRLLNEQDFSVLFEVESRIFEACSQTSSLPFATTSGCREAVLLTAIKALIN